MLQPIRSTISLSLLPQGRSKKPLRNRKQYRIELKQCCTTEWSGHILEMRCVIPPSVRWSISLSIIHKGGQMQPLHNRKQDSAGFKNRSAQGMELHNLNRPTMSRTSVVLILKSLEEISSLYTCPILRDSNGEEISSLNNRPILRDSNGEFGRGHRLAWVAYLRFSFSCLAGNETAPQLF